MKRILMMLVAGCVVLGWPGVRSARGVVTYVTELQAVNLTPYDIKITKVNWKHLDEDAPHVQAGQIIPKADETNPEQEPVQIGRVSRWMGGVDIEIWFKLIGNEGSQDCYLKVHNPFTGKNTVTPGSTFPTSQCPSVAPNIPDSKPAPLYHNITIPEAGHDLMLVALFSFQSLTPEDAGMSTKDQKKAAEESQQQIQQAESDKRKFQQETGIVLP